MKAATAGSQLPNEARRNGTSSILSAAAAPAALDRLLHDPAFAEIEAYPHTSAFGRSYHAAIHGSQDCSFAVYVEGVAALVCLCAPLDAKLAFYGMPLRLIARGDLDADTLHAAVHSAFLHLDELAEARSLREISILNDATAAASAIEQACRDRSATKHQHSVAYVDLASGATAWRRALRKSSRSLINWGRRNFAISYVNKETPDRALFDRYRAFHADVAGRVTRPEESWNVMYKWIAQGKGELIMASLDGRLIAGSMFIDGTKICIYASGVYDRTQFDKPLGHYPLWLGIERSHARGLTLLELGEIPERGDKSEKEYRIGYFKRGFATHIATQRVWRWEICA